MNPRSASYQIVAFFYTRCVGGIYQGESFFAWTSEAAIGGINEVQKTGGFK